MKNRYVPIIACTLAMLLVGSIAYAADKRKKTRMAVADPHELTEEMLKKELLTTTTAQPHLTPAARTPRSQKSAAGSTAKVTEK